MRVRSGMKINFVRYPEFGGYLLLGGSLYTEIHYGEFNPCHWICPYIEVVRSSEGPLSEFPLYIV